MNATPLEPVQDLTTLMMSTSVALVITAVAVLGAIWLIRYLLTDNRETQKRLETNQKDMGMRIGTIEKEYRTDMKDMLKRHEDMVRENVGVIRENTIAMREVGSVIQKCTRRDP